MSKRKASPAAESSPKPASDSESGTRIKAAEPAVEAPAQTPEQVIKGWAEESRAQGEELRRQIDAVYPMTRQEALHAPASDLILAHVLNSERDPIVGIVVDVINSLEMLSHQLYEAEEDSPLSLFLRRRADQLHLALDLHSRLDRSAS